MICVDLGQAIVNSTVCIEGNDQGNPRSNSFAGNRGWLAFLCPYIALEIGLVDPALVYVEDSFALRKQVQHLHRVLFSHREASNRIALYRHLLRSSIAKVKFILKGVLDPQIRHLQVTVRVNHILDLLGVLDWLA